MPSFYTTVAITCAFETNKVLDFTRSRVRHSRMMTTVVIPTSPRDLLRLGGRNNGVRHYQELVERGLLNDRSLATQHTNQDK